MDRREGGFGRNREIYIHMRYRQGKKDIKMVVSAFNPRDPYQDISQHIELSHVALNDVSMSRQQPSGQR